MFLNYATLCKPLPAQKLKQMAMRDCLQALEFLEQLLVYDPKKRLSATAAAAVSRVCLRAHSACCLCCDVASAYLLLCFVSVLPYSKASLNDLTCF